MVSAAARGKRRSDEGNSQAVRVRQVAVHNDCARRGRDSPQHPQNLHFRDRFWYPDALEIRRPFRPDSARRVRGPTAPSPQELKP